MISKINFNKKGLEMSFIVKLIILLVLLFAVITLSYLLNKQSNDLLGGIFNFF